MIDRRFLALVESLQAPARAAAAATAPLMSTITSVSHAARELVALLPAAHDDERREVR